MHFGHRFQSQYTFGRECFLFPPFIGLVSLGGFCCKIQGRAWSLAKYPTVCQRKSQRGRSWQIKSLCVFGRGWHRISEHLKWLGQQHGGPTCNLPQHRANACRRSLGLEWLKMLVSLPLFSVQLVPIYPFQGCKLLQNSWFIIELTIKCQFH